MAETVAETIAETTTDTVAGTPGAANCPFCGGEGKVMTFACAANRRDSRIGPADCSRCGGTGKVTAAQADAYAAGQRMREDRIGRGVSVREEAGRLGVTPSALSRRERGEE